MTRRKRTLSETIRHDLLRSLLERVQSEMQSRERNRKNTGTIPDTVEPICDIPYINRNGIPLAMDIYKPKVDENTELPVIITIHGGGLVAGDRTISRAFSLALAKRGYLVFSIEYRLAPRANVAEQFDDICAGMDFIGQKLVEFNVDFTRIFLTAESAGAFLATYVAAMKHSGKLQEAIGYKPTRMVFKGIGLISGMFYTRKTDPLGLILAEQLYGDRMYDEDFMRFMDPEHPEIINHLPPAFLITSRGDFLNRYTLDYHEALKKAGRRSHLTYYGEESLGHAFVTMDPDSPQAKDAIDRMLGWFEQEADRQRITSDASKAKNEQKANLQKRRKSGALHRQKLWQYIQETGAVCAETGNAPAMIDNQRRYSYHRLQYRSRQYAEVFAGREITGKNQHRIGIIADTSANAAFILLGANMVGAPCSFFPSGHLMNIDTFASCLKEEGITDLILEDHIVPAAYVKKILARKESAGIQSIMISHRRVDLSETVDYTLVRKAAENRRALKKLDGLLFMSDLIHQYEASPIAFDRTYTKTAVITHALNPDNTYRAVSFTDAEINKQITAQLQMRESEPGCPNICLIMDDFSHSCALIDMFLSSLASGGTAVAVPYGNKNSDFYKAVTNGQISTVICTIGQLNEMVKKKIRLSVFNTVFIINEGITGEDYDTLKQLNSRYGKNTKLCLSGMNPENGTVTAVNPFEQNLQTGN